MVKQVLAAFSRYDFDRALDCFHPDAVLEMADEDPLAERYVGRERIKNFWTSLFRFWDGWRVEPERFESAGGTVVVVYRVLLRGRKVGSSSNSGSRRSPWCTKGRSCRPSSTGTSERPSKPWGCRSSVRPAHRRYPGPRITSGDQGGDDDDPRTAQRHPGGLQGSGGGNDRLPRGRAGSVLRLRPVLRDPGKGHRGRVSSTTSC